MFVEIFDVEHGACALITTSNNKRVLIDCGHNGTTGWKPGNALLAKGINQVDRLYVTNYDEDHVSGYPNLLSKVLVRSIYRNPSIIPGGIRYLKSEDGMGTGIEYLIQSLEKVFTASVPAFEDYGDSIFTHYWNKYGFGLYEFDDENDLSLVVFVQCGQHKFIFPGDWSARAGLPSCGEPTS